MIEHKAQTFEVKSLDEKGTFTGYATTWGNIDREGDVIIKGCFTESLAAHKKAGTMPTMLWNHKSHLQCGDWLDMSEDDHGLLAHGRVHVGKGIDCGEQAYLMLKGTSVKGISNGFITREKAPTPPKGARRAISKAELIEASLTSMPINTRALITSVKAMESISIRDAEDFLCDAGGFTRTESKAFISAFKKGLEPARDESADILAAINNLAQRMSR